MGEAIGVRGAVLPWTLGGLLRQVAHERLRRQTGSTGDAAATGLERSPAVHSLLSAERPWWSGCAPQSIRPAGTHIFGIPMQAESARIRKQHWLAHALRQALDPHSSADWPNAKKPWCAAESDAAMVS